MMASNSTKAGAKGMLDEIVTVNTSKLTTDQKKAQS